MYQWQSVEAHAEIWPSVWKSADLWNLTSHKLGSHVRAVSALSFRAISKLRPTTARVALYPDVQTKYLDEIVSATSYIKLFKTWVRGSWAHQISISCKPIVSAKHACRTAWITVQTLKSWDSEAEVAWDNVSYQTENHLGHYLTMQSIHEMIKKYENLD